MDLLSRGCVFLDIFLLICGDHFKNIVKTNFFVSARNEPAGTLSSSVSHGPPRSNLLTRTLLTFVLCHSLPAFDRRLFPPRTTIPLSQCKVLPSFSHTPASLKRQGATMARRMGYRSGYSRWDRRDIGLKPENALSRVARTYSHFISIASFFLRHGATTRVA